MGQHIASPALAWDGTHGAVAWAESTSTGFDVRVQLLLENGTTLGSNFVVGSSLSTGVPGVAIASDTKGFVVCWDGYLDPGSLGCASIDTATSSAKVGVHGKGTAPALAFGPGGYVVGYADMAGNHALRMRADASADGAAASVALSGSPLAIAPLSTSFAAFAPDAIEDLDPVTLAAMGASGKAGVGEGGMPVAMTASGDTLGFAAVQANGEVVLSALSSPSNKGAPGARLDDPTAMPPYGKIAAAGGKSSFAVVWSTIEGNISYRGADDKGAPIGTMVSKVLDTGWDDNPVAITATSQGFLVASAVDMTYDAIKIVHLGCP